MKRSEMESLVAKVLLDNPNLALAQIAELLVKTMVDAGMLPPPNEKILVCVARQLYKSTFHRVMENHKWEPEVSE